MSPKLAVQQKRSPVFTYVQIINCAEIKYCKWHIPVIMFVIGIINATQWYVYIWIFMMESSIDSDIHLVCQLSSAF